MFCENASDGVGVGMTTDMHGKVILITGATNGIGKVAALELAKMGATVVIVGRNPSKTADVLREIRHASASDSADMIVADLSLLSGMRKAADTFRERYDRLDVLVNNAGALFARRSVTADGYEATFALNHLSYFVITNALLDMLQASAPARIINTSSGAHMGAVRGINFDDLHSEKRYTAFGAYAQSKLANVLFTRELARRLQGTGVTANSLHPGFVNTGFGKNGSNGIVAMAFRLITLVGRTPEKGAETLIYLASSPAVADVSGQYFVDNQPAAISKAAQDDEQARRLWQVSEQMVGAGAAAQP